MTQVKVIGSTFTGQLSAPSGTAAAPTFSFAVAPDMGVFYAGSNALGFANLGVQTGSVSANGAWTLGPATYSGEHTVNGQALKVFSNSLSDPYVMTMYSSSVYFYDELDHNNGTGFGVDARVFRHRGNGGAEITTGAVTAAGAWTLGPANASVNNFIQNLSTSQCALTVKNNSTSTSSDPVGAVLLQKGSPTTTAGSNYFIEFYVNAGSTNQGRIATNGANAVGFFNASDRRLKEDIVDLEDGLATVLAMRPRRHKWKSDGSEAVNFIAQEMIAAVPALVHATDDGLGDELSEGTSAWSITENGISPYLVAAIKELKSQLDDVKAEYDAYVAAHP